MVHGIQGESTSNKVVRGREARARGLLRGPPGPRVSSNYGESHHVNAYLRGPQEALKMAS